MMKKHYVASSGNIYADLGVANPQEARAKANLAHRIVDIIAGRKLTQVQAGKGLGADQPTGAALMRGRLPAFSNGGLLRFLLLVGQDVRIAVTARRPSSRKQPTLEVHAAEGRSRAIAASRRYAHDPNRS